MWQVALQIISLLWLFTVVYLLYRHAIGAGAQAQRVTVLLAESAAKSAQSAHEAAEAARRLAEILEQKHVP